MQFRLYEPEDFAALYAIEEACFAPPFRFSRRYLGYLLDACDAATWVAQRDDRLAGFAVIQWAEQDEGSLAYLQTLEVAPEFQRQGVGRELLGLSEESACRAGAIQVWLHVDEQNEAALRLYETNGYLREGRKENYYAHNRAALILCKQWAPESAG
jgi:ribosomal-protein-alanine N-acetyltransferase